MKGVENLSFSEAIEQEETRVEENIFKGYKKRSIYVEQVKRYLSYFPKENMHFIIFEKLIAEPNKELDKLYDFLGVDNKTMAGKSKNKEIKANQSYIPFSISLQYHSRNLFGGNSKIYKAVNYFNKAFANPRPPLSSPMRSMLNNFF
ncbi:MAG: sulfotransferase domain-containing protein [Balneolaceae bacterium]|nr:sulfotransferase domain-containing protein [Balneolaceae bacterium]